MKQLARQGLVLAVTAAALVATVWAVSWAFVPREPAARMSPAEREARRAAAEAARDVSFEPEDRYSLHRQARVEPRGQSPILAELVERGELPPLAERLPEHPVVMAGVDGIGTYGGTWLRVAVSPGDVSIIDYRLSGAQLVRWSPLGYPIEPHIAEAVEPSADYRVWGVTLRKGLRWSDGHPYTADDIMYWWEREVTHADLADTPPDWMRNGGAYGRVEKVDDYHVRFVFDDPHPLFLEQLATPGARMVCNSPAHYLRPYHPDPAIGDPARVAREPAAYGLPSLTALYRYMKDFRNPEHPRLWPWVYRTFRSSPPQTFVRNPYYYVVDPAGNQLPYLDRVQFDLQDNKMFALTAANGGVSMQTRHVRFQDYTELTSRQATAGTRVLHWYPAVRSVYVINPNLNRRVDPDEPATAWKAELLSDKRFRQALSLALDREAIIRADFSGFGEPAQVAPGPESRFHHERLQRAFTEHDPARADALLDELGLGKRDGAGYRTFPDGTRMVWYLDTTEFTGVGPAQFLVDQWKAVDLRVIARERSRPLFYLEKNSRNFDLNVWTGESDMMPLVYARYFVPANTEAFYAVGWGKWFARGGYFGLAGSEDDGSVPVPPEHPMYEAITHYVAAQQSTDPAEQERLMRRVLDIAAENTWSISIATPPPQPVVVKEGFKNVPPVALYGVIYSTPANAGIETYYMEQSNNSPGAIAEISRSIVTPTLRPSAGGGGGLADDAGPLGAVIRWSLIGIAAAGLVLLIARHPFVLRRLLILVPTLLVISVVVFTIIQLPPGDFLATRIIQLQESGDATAEQQIRDLRDLFHFDEPVVGQYLRWMGIRWFWTYEQTDLGLLQGRLGRSMETTQPVNDMVGDRVLLTMAISAGTILFTWIIAIPIGIYSAVRQYSITDYALTVIGFIGMCVPAFLLALVLMAVSGVTGLFSPEYAAQPEWTTGKVIDLLRHIWIPILVLGVGGTAGMIRIMRANLLDELRRPYVTTAMAKGVPPTRLLMKYPVRLALNPFISGIGGLFPQLISGGAIVAMVLALPTVGPMLLSALFSQDMYLAGSLLMVLSLLGVLGTLVSDLLLLWLDPRIRFEGGSR